MDANFRSADGAEAAGFVCRNVETWNAGRRCVRLYADRVHCSGVPVKYAGSRYEYAFADGYEYASADEYEYASADEYCRNTERSAGPLIFY